MAKGPNQKLKLMFLADILRRKTDEEHALQLPEIIDYLADYGITCERKALYQDFEELRKYGLDIQGYKEGNYYYYHLCGRDFDIAELKLIIDSIQAAKFISEHKSQELIKKIENLASDYEAEKLHRQVLISGRVKTMNESIYYTVDSIHRAINEKKQIQFQYTKWNLQKQLEKRHKGDFIKVTPWALMWDDENYYLVAYDPAEDKIKHYRVDKMLKLSVVDEKPEGRRLIQALNTSDYARQHFGMFGGEVKEVELMVCNDLIGVMIDRFGKKIPVWPVDDGHFKTFVKVAVSPQFFGWILSLGEGIKVLGPEDVVMAMTDRVRKLNEIYQ